MPRPRTPLDDYAFDRVEQLHRQGGTVHEHALTEVAGEIQILVSVTFGREDQCLLRVFEAIVMRRGRPRRRKYSYHCKYRDEFVFRYCRDFEGHPRLPEHKHLPPTERRVRWGRVTLTEVMDELWAAVGDREEEEDELAENEEET